MNNTDNAKKLVEQRQQMAECVRRDGVKDGRIIEALKVVPRHEFIYEDFSERAYEQAYLLLEEGISISHPFIVAYMAEKLELNSNDKVLDIGSGTGYHASIMAQVAGEVYGVEVLGPWAKRAGEVTKRLGYSNVHFRHGDGFYGWPEEAQFDKINVVCAAPAIPKTLLAMLKVGGKMILPIGPIDKPPGQNAQKLVLVEKTREAFVEDGIQYDAFINTTELRTIHVVPMVGEVNKQTETLIVRG